MVRLLRNGDVICCSTYSCASVCTPAEQGRLDSLRPCMDSWNSFHTCSLFCVSLFILVKLAGDLKNDWSVLAYKTRDLEVPSQSNSFSHFYVYELPLPYHLLIYLIQLLITMRSALLILLIATFAGLATSSPVPQQDTSTTTGTNAAPTQTIKTSGADVFCAWLFLENSFYSTTNLLDLGDALDEPGPEKLDRRMPCF